MALYAILFHVSRHCFVNRLQKNNDLTLSMNCLMICIPSIHEISSCLDILNLFSAKCLILFYSILYFSRSSSSNSTPSPMQSGTFTYPFSKGIRIFTNIRNSGQLDWEYSKRSQLSVAAKNCTVAESNMPVLNP